MLQIIYGSAATHKKDAAKLTGLLRAARENNEKVGITGFLLYDAGSFLQVIEGPDKAVTALYTRILADLRHERIRLLSMKPVTEREFGDWAMAFSRTPGDQAASCEGFLDYALSREEFHLDGSEVSQILALFQEGLLRQASESPAAADNFSVTVTPNHNAAPRQSKFLLDFGRAMALTVPDVPISVERAGSETIHFNLRRDMEMGEVELF